MSPKLPAERLQFRRPIAQILSDLSRPIPERLIRRRVGQGGKTVSYIPWYYAARLLDLYAPGWIGEVKGIQEIGDFVVVTYAITIQAEEGTFTREATGQERLNNGFTEAVCSAEAQAFKRACSKFGLALDLYED